MEKLVNDPKIRELESDADAGEIENSGWYEEKRRDDTEWNPKGLYASLFSSIHRNKNKSHKVFRIWTI